MEFRIPAVQSLVQAGGVETDSRRVEGSGSRMFDARLDCDSRPPACGGKKGGNDALGRSRGGFSSKVHLAVDAEGRPVELIVTPGQVHDSQQATALLAEHKP